MHLFCIPYAGGNAWSYRALAPFLSPGITLEGLELPGRGRRGLEPLCGSLDDLAADVVRQIEQRAVTGAYALYGHSMGALLAYLAAQRMRAAGLAMPRSLFLSGSSAPASREVRRRHLLSPPEFKAMLRDLGGCPPQVLDDPELLDFFEPILRADFKAVETWQHREQPPLDIPLTVMSGTSDHSDAGDTGGWASETTAECRLLEFSGDHFFILNHWGEIGATIQRQLIGATPAWT